MTGHRTSTGHIPAARAISWACTCGAAWVGTYGHTVTAAYALELAARRAAHHRIRHALATDLETP